MPSFKIKQNGEWVSIFSKSTDIQNADTLDGKHADEFASTEEINELKNLVGETSVSEQIDTALVNFSSGKTLSEHLQEEMMILTSLQYGDELPEPTAPGRIFFKKVST